jgi:phage-related protein
MSSDNTDTRVVELDFDNKQFEKNAKQSISTLDKLKKALSFDKASDGIEEVTVSLSKMEVAAATVIQNITNRVVNLGVTFVESLSIDNIIDGWTKFGQKTTSVATMAAQTIKVAGKELDNYTEKMATINTYLSELNWFSDETSYTFTDMVDNIGKFTAAGQDLDSSVKAMMGIANWAALSGQNATTASRAMYQLSQALSKGYVQLLDYKSIQNANMDTQEFRETVLDTAVALGELTKSGDNYITKTGKKFTKNQFTEELSEKWFTGDVLLKSLSKYSSAVEEIYSIAQETGLTTSEVIDQYGDSLDEFGVKAFKAAQEARTFSDTLSSVKDAYSTAWMKTFETIFGSYDDAKELWTDMANELYDVFVSSGELRNEWLAIWKDLEGRADLFAHTGNNDQGAFWNIYDAIVSIRDVIKEAWNDIFPKSVFSETADQAEEIGTRVKQITSNLQAFTRSIMPTEETLEKLRKIFNGIFSIAKFTFNLLKLFWALLQPIVSVAKNFVSLLTSLASTIGGGLDSALNKIISALEKVVKWIWEVVDSIYDGLNIKSIVSGLKNFGSNITSTFKNIWNNFKTYIKPILDTVKNGASSIGNFFSGVFSRSSKNDTSSNTLKNNNSIKSARKTLAYDDKSANQETSISFIEKMKEVGEKVLDILNKLWSIAVSIAKFIGKIITVLSKAFKKFLDSFDLWVDNLTERVEPFIESLNISTNLYAVLNSLIKVWLSIVILGMASVKLIANALNTIASLINKVAAKIQTIADDSEEISSAISKFGNKLIIFGKSIINVFSSLITLLGSAFNLIGDLFKLLASMIEKIIPTIQNAFSAFSALDTSFKVGLYIVLGTAAVLTLVVLGIKLISDIIWQLSGPIKNLSNSVSNFLDNKALSNTITSMARLMTSIGVALLSFAVACTVIQTLDPAVVISVVSVLAVFIAGIGVLTIVLAKLSKATNSIQTSFLKLKKEGGAATLKNTQQQMNNILMQMASFILSIGATLLLFAKSVQILSGIDIVSIIKAMGALLVFMAAIGGIIVGLMAATKLMKDGESFNDLSKMSKPLAALAVTMLSFAASISLLSSLDAGSMWSAMAAMTIFVAVIEGMFAVVAVASKQSNVSGNNNKVAGQFTGMASALLAISSVMISLSTSLVKIASLATSVGWPNVWIAFAVISSLIVEIGAISVGLMAATKLINQNGDPAKMMKSISSFISSISAFVAIATLSLTALTALDTSKAFIAIGELAALITTMSAISVMVSKFGGDNKSATTSFFIGMSVALLAASGAISILAGLDMVKAAAAAASLAILISTIALATSKVGKNAKMSNLISFFAGLSAAVLACSVALMLLSKYDWQSMLAAAGAISAIIAVFAAAVIAINKIGGDGISVRMIAFAVALNLVSAAMVILASAMVVMSQAGDIGTLGKSLLLLAAGIAAFAVAAVALSSAIPMMLLLATSLTLLGVGLLTTSYALSALTSQLVPICETINENIELITETFTNMANSIGDMIANIVVNALQNLSDMSTAIFETITTLLNGLIDTLKSVLPNLFELIKEVVGDVLELINEYGDDIIATVVDLITTLLQKLDENAEPIFDAVFSILQKLLDKLEKNIPNLVDSLIDIVVLTFNTLTKNVDKLVTSITKFLIATFKALIKAIGTILPTIIKSLLNVIGLVIRLIGSSLGTLLGDIIIFLGYLIDVFLQAIRGMGKVIGQAFMTVIAIVIEAIHNVVTNSWDIIKNAFKLIFSDLYKIFLEGLKDVFGWVPFFGDWIDDQLESVNSTINDSSSYFSELASGKGIQQAAKEAANNINSAMDEFNEDIAENTSAGISSIMNAFNDFLEDEDTEITITPVIDDSEIDNIADDLETSMDTSGTSSTANAAKTAVAGTATSKTVTNETTYNNNNTYNPTFNISGNYDANEIADIVDQRMQMNAQTGRLTKGLV